MIILLYLQHKRLQLLLLLVGQLVMQLLQQSLVLAKYLDQNVYLVFKIMVSGALERSPSMCLMEFSSNLKIQDHLMIFKILIKQFKIMTVDHVVVQQK